MITMDTIVRKEKVLVDIINKFLIGANFLIVIVIELPNCINSDRRMRDLRMFFFLSEHVFLLERIIKLFEMDRNYSVFFRKHNRYLNNH